MTTTMGTRWRCSYRRENHIATTTLSLLRSILVYVLFGASFLILFCLFPFSVPISSFCVFRSLTQSTPFSSPIGQCPRGPWNERASFFYFPFTYGNLKHSVGSTYSCKGRQRWSWMEKLCDPRYIVLDSISEPCPYTQLQSSPSIVFFSSLRRKHAQPL